MMRSLALLVASLCPVLQSASAKLTWGTTKNLFVFGDSYTTTGYNVTLGVDSATPGWTSSNGPNWVMSLTDTYNVNQTKVYNLAYGGATTDSQLVTPYLPTVISFDDQVDLWNKYFSPPPELAPWKSSDTLFAIMIGINDIGNSWYWTNVTQIGFHKTLLNRYFDLWCLCHFATNTTAKEVMPLPQSQYIQIRLKTFTVEALARIFSSMCHR
ncbi:hypothetical protein BKA62DRAFT_667687 [Auriculariales sp. MPI-PUGE-AT-0066]|nr:hypothetical protein BKA62DRAFT_667687 [Auriculariales sp. MPI-PUGE-AT-0066]